MGVAKPAVSDRGEDAAVAAVAAVAHALGFCGIRPRVIAAGWSFVIALEPFPVVARVSHRSVDQQRVPLGLQVQVASFAAERGGPVVPPLAGGKAGPHIQGDYVVTFWERIRDHPVTPESVGRSLRRLHDVLVDFPGALPSFDPRPGVRRIAATLPPRFTGTAVVLFDACDACPCPEGLPGRALHGDVHFGNALGGPAGPLWNDFEYACVGPVEWDLAGAAHQAAVFGKLVEETRALLTGYGNDAVERSFTLLDAVGLHMAAQTAAAMVTRPALQPQAQQRLAWLRRRLNL